MFAEDHAGFNTSRLNVDKDLQVATASFWGEILFRELFPYQIYNNGGQRLSQCHAYLLWSSGLWGSLGPWQNTGW